MTNSLSIRTALKAGLLLTVLFLGYCGVHFLYVKRTMETTRAALNQGFTMLAVERLEPVKKDIPKKAGGCELLVETYFAAKRVDLLQWAAEACMDAGKDNPTISIALATSYELRNQDGIAAQIMQGAIKKFEKSADVYFHSAQILKRNKNVEEASKFLSMAIDRAPQNQNMVLDALQYYLETKQNDLARTMATRLKATKIDNPEVKLVIARGLKKGGDSAGAKAQVQEALQIASSDPKLKAQLEAAYKDVISTQ